MRILFIFLSFTALIRPGGSDVIFTKERCSRETYGLRVQLGDPSRYRQCGPNGRIWIVPCVPGAIFDPLNKMCKEQSKPASPFTLSQVRRKSAKSEENRKRPDPELTPISEEFIFSTKRPMRPRPKNKSAASTLFPTTTEATKTRLPSTEDGFPISEVPITFKTSTGQPYSPAFNPPTNKPNSMELTRRPKMGLSKMATTGASAITPSQIFTEVAGPVNELQLTSAHPLTFTHTTSPQLHTVGTTVSPQSAEHTINYKGITMSEDEFFKQLLRIVQAHQMAINKIEQETEEEHRNAGRHEVVPNHTEERKKIELGELERQRQLQIVRELYERQERERQEFEWQRRIAMQQAEIQRQEEQMRRQLEEAEEHKRRKVLAWQQEIARQKEEYEMKQRELEIERQAVERQRQGEGTEREDEIRRQKEILRQAAEKKKKEEARKRAEAEKTESKWQEAARQKVEKQRQEEQRKEQEEVMQLADKQKKERERKEEIDRQRAEKQEVEREREEELAQLKAERLQREKEQKEKIRRRKLEKERLRKEEEQRLERELRRKEKERRLEQERQKKEERKRLESERKVEKERKEPEQLAIRGEMNGSAVTKPGFRIYPEQSTTDGNTDTSGYHSNNDLAKTIMAGVMTVSNRKTTATEAPDIKIIHFTASPPTPSSPATEWVTSPHSWRPPPDVQTNTLDWTQIPQIPSTGTSELPSMITSRCSSVENCDFSYEADLLCPHSSNPNRYLQCTPMIGKKGQWAERMCPPHLVFMPYYARCGLSVEAALNPYAKQKLLPRLPSEPEVVHWKGNKELTRIVDQKQNPQVATFAPMQQSFIEKPLFKIIEGFPQGLLPPLTYINNTIPSEYYKLDENANIDPSATAPLFPLLQPHFLMPFGKFRDAFRSKEQSFMGSIVKPAIKKIALDQTETFLDRILSDQIPAEKPAEIRSEERSMSPQRSEDGWRRFA